MAITLIQGTRKDGTTYHNLKKDTRALLHFTEAQYFADTTTLSIMFSPEDTSSVEVIAYKDKAKVDPKPVEYPIRIDLKLDITDNNEPIFKAVHNYFTILHPELAGGCGGEIEFMNSKTVQKMADGVEVKEALIESIFTVVPVESSLTAPATYGTKEYKPAQTEADIIKHRLDYLDKLINPDSAEHKQAMLMIDAETGIFDTFKELVSTIFGKG